MEQLFWIRNLAHHLRLHRVLLVFGNIYDRFPLQLPAGEAQEALAGVLRWAATEAGLPGFSDLDLAAGEAQRGSAQPPTAQLDRLRLDATEPTLLVLRNAQAAFPEVTHWNARDWVAYAGLLRLIEQAAELHRLVLVFPDEARIPVNLFANLPGVKRLLVPLPEGLDIDGWTRERLSAAVAGDRAVKAEDALRRFVALADGLRWAELRMLETSLERQQASGNAAESPITLLRRLKFGDPRDRWGELVSRERARLNQALAELTGGDDPILGQQDAVEKAVRVVARACFNVAEIGSPSYRRPRGVLFLVGPTGVGKTMLAKKLARLIFGDEDACITFDMSEYGLPQSEARLVGAPPGYVGYDAEGQLTGAVLRNPFSVLLFDEIEKADGSILTKFLQILDEGRLTDSKGQVAYFSECLIVFTSNVGQQSAAGLPDSTSHAELVNHYLGQLMQHEKFIERPELLNRIGTSSIVPFRHLRDRQLVERVVLGLIDKTQAHFQRLALPLSLQFEEREAIVGWIADQAKWQAYGLRNVKQSFESEVLEPIAVSLLGNPDHRPTRVRLAGDRIDVSVRQ